MRFAIERIPIFVLCGIFLLANASLTRAQAGQDVTGSQDLFALSKKPQPGRNVISAMREIYAGRWYKTTTFTQRTTEFGGDGSKKVSTWYEAISAPGKLRIDFEPLKSKDGILFVADKIHQFQGGKVEKSQPLVHPLLLLGFDVYFLPVDESVRKLKLLKFDLTKFREDTWQGRPVYVVGTGSPDDARSPQFWIDKGRLYLVRMLRPKGTDSSSIEEVQFNNYRRLGGGWIAPEVIFKVDGRTTTTEIYSDIRANVTLSDDLFDPEKWATVKHWKE